MQIKDYWIPKIQDIREFKYISTAEQPEIDILKGMVDGFFEEIIVETATNNGLSRYEKMLGLPKKIEREERVSTILLNLTNKFPITEKYLRKILLNLLGEGNFEMNVSNYQMDLKVVSTKEHLLDMFRSELRRKIPANIALKVNIIENLKTKFYVGTYTRSADVITLKFGEAKEDEGSLSIPGKAIVGKWIIGKDNLS